MILRHTSLTSLILFLNLFLISCGQTEEDESGEFRTEVERVGELRLKNTSDGIWSMVRGTVSDEENEQIYGIDYRSRRLYVIDVATETISFISVVGSGPGEFDRPNQIALGVNGLIVNDLTSDRISMLDREGELISDIEGTLSHGVWIRGTYSIYHSGTLISSMKDPQYVQLLDFEAARAISLFDLSTGDLTKAGKFPENIDRLDAFQKFPLIPIDEKREQLYYVFSTLPDVMKLNLNTLESELVSDYNPSFIRTRTMEVDYRDPRIQEVAFMRELGADRSELLGVFVLNDYFISTWTNTTDYYFTSLDPADKEYFGVMYSIPDFEDPREFTLPGKPLGIYDGNLLILEDDDPLNFVIGKYVVKSSL